MSANEQALVKQEKTPIAMGARGIQLQTFEDLYRFATVVVQTPFAPRDFRTAESVMIACAYGMELGLSPMASLQNIAVVNGKPSVYGDALIGVVEGSGLLEDINERMEGEGDDRRAVCWVKRKGRPTPVERSFSVKDAKTAKLWGKTGRDGQPTPWVHYPERMLAMRARGFALRDAFADILRGIITREEAEDYPEPEVKNVTPIREVEPERITQKKMRVVLQRAAACKPPVDHNLLAVEHFGAVVDQLTEAQANDLLDIILEIQAGERRHPATVEEPSGAPNGYAQQILETVRENAPHVAEAMEPYLPRDAAAVGEAADLGVILDAVEEVAEAVAKDDLREERWPSRAELIDTLQDLRADERSWLDERGRVAEQPKLTKAMVEKFTDARLVEVIDETRARVKALVN